MTAQPKHSFPVGSSREMGAAQHDGQPIPIFRETPTAYAGRLHAIRQAAFQLHPLLVCQGNVRIPAKHSPGIGLHPFRHGKTCRVVLFQQVSDLSGQLQSCRHAHTLLLRQQTRASTAPHVLTAIVSFFSPFEKGRSKKRWSYSRKCRERALSLVNLPRRPAAHMPFPGKR